MSSATNGHRPPELGEELWADSLLASDTERLIDALRNYVGPVRSPYDKRELVKKLSAFLRKSETREAIADLVDPADARMIGALMLTGPLSEEALKFLFAGELSFFESGTRIANLLDRLVFFRFDHGDARLLAVNPLLADTLAPRLLDPDLLFGSASRGEGDLNATAGESPPGPGPAHFLIAFFSFLFHEPKALRRSGGLSGKGMQRALVLFAEFPGCCAQSLDFLVRAFAALGFIQVGDREPRADRAAFAAALEQWGRRLPAYVAASLPLTGAAGAALEPRRRKRALTATLPPAQSEALALPPSAAEVELLAAGIEAPPRDFVFSPEGLSLWLRIAMSSSASCREAGYGMSGPSGSQEPWLRDPAELLPALQALGLVRAVPGGLRCEGLAAGAADQEDGSEARTGAPVLVAEGAHAIHALPEAGARERLLAASIGSPRALGRVWSFEIGRESARRAFAAGLSADELLRGLEKACGVSLPQSLVFSLKAWDEEYNALQVYEGRVLAADERLAAVVERSSALKDLVARRLAPGVYLLKAAPPEALEAAFARAGLESPAMSATPLFSARSDQAELGLEAPRDTLPRAKADGIWIAAADRAEPAAGAAKDVAARLARRAGFGGAASGKAWSLDPRARLERLSRALEASSRSPEEKRELSERMERRLVLTESQIKTADPRMERLEASGLDYTGKLRVVERCLRSPGDRLELLYRLPGGQPLRALIRPVRLVPLERGLALEAEDLSTGGAMRVPLGSVSKIKRVRASLFGDER